MISSSKVIRWGLVGCGQTAITKSIPGLLAADGARLVAIADPLPARRELALKLAADAGGARVRAYADATELFADAEVDAVYLGLPVGDHAAVVVAAAGAGKAILCGKPLGRNFAEFGVMVRVAQEAGVPLMNASGSRFSGVFQKAAQLIREGAIGKVTFVTSHLSSTFRDRQPRGASGRRRLPDVTGGGVLLDVGVSLAFGVREILGERIARVTSFIPDTHKPPGWIVPAVRIGTGTGTGTGTATAWFITDQGTPGTLVATSSHDARSIHFHGTKGNLTVTDCFQETPGTRLEVTGENPFVLDTKTEPGLAPGDNYRREFEHYSQALLTRTAHESSVEEALADASLFEALGQKIPATRRSFGAGRIWKSQTGVPPMGRSRSSPSLCSPHALVDCWPME